MGEGPPLLIRRDAQRALSLAIAWFLAIPALVLGYLAVVLPLAAVLPADCFRETCERQPFDPSPLLLAAACLILVGIGSLVLYRLTYGPARLAWTVVAVIGSLLVVAALAFDVANGLRWEVALITFAWPMAPGLMAIDGAWRSRRSPGSS